MQLSLGKCNEIYKEVINQAAVAAGDTPPTKIRAALNQDQYLCSRFFSQAYELIDGN